VNAPNKLVNKLVTKPLRGEAGSLAESDQQENRNPDWGPSGHQHLTARPSRGEARGGKTRNPNRVNGSKRAVKRGNNDNIAARGDGSK